MNKEFWLHPIQSADMTTFESTDIFVEKLDIEKRLFSHLKLSCDELDQYLIPEFKDQIVSKKLKSSQYEDDAHVIAIYKMSEGREVEVIVSAGNDTPNLSYSTTNTNGRPSSEPGSDFTANSVNEFVKKIQNYKNAQQERKDKQIQDAKDRWTAKEQKAQAAMETKMKQQRKKLALITICLDALRVKLESHNYNNLTVTPVSVSYGNSGCSVTLLLNDDFIHLLSRSDYQTITNLFWTDYPEVRFDWESSATAIEKLGDRILKMLPGQFSNTT